MDADKALRGQLSRLMLQDEAHTSFDAAVGSIPPAIRGIRPDGLPHSVWDLVEHIRIAQRDILDFCLPEKYVSRAWPDEYWPTSPGPQSPTEWDESVAAVRRDRDGFLQLIADPAIDLFSVVPHGKKQTYLREVLLAADHMAYHVGQLMVVRQLL
jgi:hypothetical protein